MLAQRIYILMRSLQIPGNIVITKVQPRLLLPSIVILWGAVVCFMSLIHNHQGLWGLRFTLGFAEAVSNSTVA